ncbi:MAG: hypothetical protein HUU16_17305, partial [Candidatus Omnitrophica bacterium]|nr:hypothetical protein [Candidatus Omnitrophota bacterium]
MGKLIGILLLLFALCAALAITKPVFGSQSNILSLTRQIAFLGIYSMGAAVVIITGQVPTHAIGQDAFQEVDTV